MFHAVTHGRRLSRIGLALAVGVLALALPACEGEGNFTLLGYTTAPNYSSNVHTVHVPIFKNLTLYRGLEFDLTAALVREIEQTTPFKVVGCREGADTEIVGSILTYTKNMLNRNQLNEVREAEMVMTVSVVWKDLRTGEVLSQPRPRGEPPPPPLPPPNTLATAPLAGGTPPSSVAGQPVPPLDESGLALPAPPPLPKPIPVIVQSNANFIPEVGGSITTAQKSNVDKIAVQIVHMMEKPW